MEILRLENLTFKYPNAQENAIDNINLSVKEGDFTLLCGASGCGKSTMLRLIKKELAPFGEKSGKIIFQNTETQLLSDRESASQIGFVLQNPENQIVTDKVWHELAFGLENLGIEPKLIRRRIAETSSYFGIQSLYRQDTATLSGGQKQLLNLAAVMVMQPRLLILDEPTGHLDPIAAADFIEVLQKLNRETGLTIIIAEHRLEELFPLASKVVVMENGKIIANDTPENVGTAMKNNPISKGFPSAVRIFQGLDIAEKCPISVKDGRSFILRNFADKKGLCLEKKHEALQMPAIEAKNVWFRYRRELPDIMRGVNLTVYEGEIFALLGGNGTGKTTTLQVLAALDRPYRGSIKINGISQNKYKNNELYNGVLSLLPQNPQSVFLKETVYEDLEEICGRQSITKEEIKKQIEKTAKQLKITHLLARHPYDLSGGEQQKCALAKILMTEPKIILLDEPTKGLDAASKQELISVLQSLKAEKITVLMVSHDIEFAAQAADRCALFFDGEIISNDTPESFFSQNSYYTTAASRISRDIFKNAVLCDDVITLCKGAAK